MKKKFRLGERDFFMKFSSLMIIDEFIVSFRAKEFEKLQNKVEEQRKKIRESGNKIKEKNFLSFLVKNQRK